MKNGLRLKKRQAISFFSCSYAVRMREIDPDVSAFPVEVCLMDCLMGFFSTW